MIGAIQAPRARCIQQDSKTIIHRHAALQ